jgi:hypothetical protein
MDTKLEGRRCVAKMICLGTKGLNRAVNHKLSCCEKMFAMLIGVA